MRRSMYTLLGFLLAIGVAGCRGDLSEDPPIHFNPNMDNQQRWDPQEPIRLKSKTRAMRKQPPGTVARGTLKTDRHLHAGKVGGVFVRGLPPSLKLDRALLDRGRERYNVYCAGCHDRLGTGQGFVYRVNAGLPRPVSFQDKRMQAAPIGELFHSMTFGKSQMPALGYLIPPADRWAIVSYIRALQLSQNAQTLKAGR